MDENPERRHFIFNAKDLQEQRAALDEFQTRHSTITERIAETYKIGTTMLDYLEKQTILSYHFRGEQDQFEQQFPDLVAKAKKYIGFELYFALSPFSGHILNPESANPIECESYKALADIQTKLNLKIDEYLKKQNVQEEQEPETDVKDPVSKWEARHYCFNQTIESYR